MTDPDLIVGDRREAADPFVNDAALAPLLAELKAELIAATEKNEQLQERVDELEDQLEEFVGVDLGYHEGTDGPGYDVIVATVRQVHELTHSHGWVTCTDPVCRIVSRFA